MQLRFGMHDVFGFHFQDPRQNKLVGLTVRGAGGRLPCKPSDLSLILRIHVKKVKHSVCLASQALGRQRWEDLCGLLVSQASLMWANSRFTEKACLKYKVKQST